VEGFENACGWYFENLKDNNNEHTQTDRKKGNAVYKRPKCS
jgi:hypothetical protein